MHRLRLGLATAVATWAFSVACLPSACNYIEGGYCPRGDANLKALAEQLSSSAKVYFPGSSGFKDATTRWSALEEPKVNVIVVPGTENDVAETVR
jgi:hypothetical protein